MYAWLEKPPLRTAGPQTIVTTGSFYRSPRATTSPLPARDRFSIRSGDLHGAVRHRAPDADGASSDVSRQSRLQIGKSPCGTLELEMTLAPCTVCRRQMRNAPDAMATERASARRVTAEDVPTVQRARLGQGDTGTVASIAVRRVAAEDTP